MALVRLVLTYHLVPLVAGVAGGAAIVAVRTISRSAQQLMDALNIERQG